MTVKSKQLLPGEWLVMMMMTNLCLSAKREMTVAYIFLSLEQFKKYRENVKKGLTRVLGTLSRIYRYACPAHLDRFFLKEDCRVQYLTEY